MPAPITALYAGILGASYFILGIRVSNFRRKLKVSIGDGSAQISQEIAANRNVAEMEKKMAPLAKAIRVHANFGEYIPFMITLLGSLELNGFSKNAIHIFGFTIILSRALLSLGIYGKNSFGPTRFPGAILNYVLLFSLSVANIYEGWKINFS